MSGGRAWTTTEERRLRELRAARTPTKIIAQELGRTEDAIYNFLRYIPASRDTAPGMRKVPRLPPPPPKPRRRDLDWTPEEIERMRELAADGTTAKDTATELGRSYTAVRCKAANLGIKFPRKGRNSICRLEQESNHFRKDAVEGSAKLLQALFATVRPQLKTVDSDLSGESNPERIAA